MTEQQRLELEAATFRRLLEHLQKRSDVQNIDLMNLAGFCRNCLGKWYKAAADERGIELLGRIVGQRPLCQVENLIVFQFVGAFGETEIAGAASGVLQWLVQRRGRRTQRQFGR